MTVPHYISENQFDMRGIKHGWYAIEDDGNLIFWTFSQFRGMPHGNQSVSERDDGDQVATRAALNTSLNRSTGIVEGGARRSTQTRPLKDKVS